MAMGLKFLVPSCVGVVALKTARLSGLNETHAVPVKLLCHALRGCHATAISVKGAFRAPHRLWLAELVWLCMARSVERIK